jgi:hypothetical protein
VYFYQFFLARFSPLSEHSFFTKLILANKSIILKLIRPCYTAVEGDKASLNPKEQNTDTAARLRKKFTAGVLTRYLIRCLQDVFKKSQYFVCFK